MTAFEQLPRSPHDKLLFTPGPLTTSMTVKQAMLRDLGARDHEFRRVIVEVREGLLEVAGVSRADGYEAIPMQGCGTMGLEAVLASALPPQAKSAARKPKASLRGRGDVSAIHIFGSPSVTQRICSGGATCWSAATAAPTGR